MRAVFLGCMALLMCGCLLFAGCGAGVSAAVGKYSADLQGDSARVVDATTWTIEFKADGTFEEVLVVRSGDTTTRKGTFEVMGNSINMYIDGRLQEDDFTVQEDRLIDQLGGVWMKQ